MMAMKLFAVLGSLAAACYAQNVAIGSPLGNSTVYPGQYINVEVLKPVSRHMLDCLFVLSRFVRPQNSLSSSTEVAVVVSMAPCPSDGCTSTSYNPANFLGQILYNGPYNPQPHPEDQPFYRPPYQNFTLPVPTSFTPGEKVAVIVTHFSLIGVRPVNHTSSPSF